MSKGTFAAIILHPIVQEQLELIMKVVILLCQQMKMQPSLFFLAFSQDKYLYKRRLKVHQVVRAAKDAMVLSCISDIPDPMPQVQGIRFSWLPDSLTVTQKTSNRLKGIHYSCSCRHTAKYTACLMASVSLSEPCGYLKSSVQENGGPSVE